MSSADKIISIMRQTKMKFEDRAKSDLEEVLSNYKDLTPMAEFFVSPDNLRRQTFALKGTIPISYKGHKYHIPIALYLMDNHPYAPPYCYVCPTPNMRIKTSENVDDKGRVYFPYLNEWQYPKYDTFGLLQVMIVQFQEKCPVYTMQNTKRDQPSTTTNPPYPVPGSDRSMYPTGPGNYGMPTPTTQSTPYPNNAAGYVAPYPAYQNVIQPSIPSSQPPVPYGSNNMRPNPAQSSWNRYSTTMGSANDDPSAIPPQSRAPSQPVPPPHYASSIRASLITALEERVRNRLQDKLGAVIEDTQRLDICLNDMRSGQKQLRDFLDKAQRDQNRLNEQLSVYQSRRQELQLALDKYRNSDSNSGSDLDTAIDVVTPLHRQIFDNYVMDLTMDDLMYHLAEALKKRTIALPVFLSYVRQCYRKKFAVIVTMNKGRQVAGLPCITE